MRYTWNVLMVVLCLSAAGVFAGDDKPNISPLTLGIGYDEGLSGKLFLTDRFALYLSLGYDVTGAPTGRDQPINNFSSKLGFSFALFESSKFLLHTFVEGMDLMTQHLLEPTDPAKVKVRYNKWDVAARAGLCPELFLTDRLSLSYKFGFEYVSHGTDYQLNDAGETQKVNNNYSSAGIYGYTTGKYMLLHNIGITVYLKK
jgi:hypothetical protein